MTFADLHIKALQVAQECVALGARIRTIRFITGLESAELVRLFFRQRASAPRGRPPDSAEWYHAANLACQVESCIFVTHFARLQHRGFTPATALLSAYKHYLNLVGSQPRISFDRAFDLASHLDGRWVARSPSLTVLGCTECGCDFLSALGTTASDDCPFCKLRKRYPHDPRLQEAFPERAYRESFPTQPGSLDLL